MACTFVVGGYEIINIINTSYQKLPFGSGDDPDEHFKSYVSCRQPQYVRGTLQGVAAIYWKKTVHGFVL